MDYASDEPTLTHQADSESGLASACKIPHEDVRIWQAVFGRFPDYRTIAIIFTQLHRLVIQESVLGRPETNEKIGLSRVGTADQSRFSQGRLDKNSQM